MTSDHAATTDHAGDIGHDPADIDKHVRVYITVSEQQIAAALGLSEKRSTGTSATSSQSSVFPRAQPRPRTPSGTSYSESVAAWGESPMRGAHPLDSLAEALRAPAA